MTLPYLITVDTEKWIGTKKKRAGAFFKEIYFIFLFFFPFEALLVRITLWRALKQFLKPLVMSKI